MNASFSAWIAGLAMAAAPLAAAAQGTISAARGEVRSAVETAAPAPAAAGHRLRNGETVSTGPGASASLVFPDGLLVALEESTAVKLLDYRYGPAGSIQRDRAAIELSRGAIRVVTGNMVVSTRDAVSVHAPQARIVSGGHADFTAVLVNPMYVVVSSGSVAAINKAGSMALGRGQAIEILNASATPLNVMPSTLPQAAAAPVHRLRLASGTPGGPLTGAAPTAAGGGAGLGLPALGAAAAAAAAAIAAGSGGGDSGSSTTHH